MMKYTEYFVIESFRSILLTPDVLTRIWKKGEKTTHRIVILIGYDKQIKCPECDNTIFKTDFRKKERFCCHCGLIVQDMTLITLKQKEYIEKIQTKKSPY